MQYKRYNRPSDIDGRLDRELMKRKFDQVTRGRDPKQVEALRFVIGGEGVGLNNVELTQGQRQINKTLNELMDWVDMDSVELDVVREVGLKRVKKLSLQEIKIILAEVKANGVRLGELKFYIQDRLLEIWRARFGDANLVDDVRFSHVRVQTEEELEELIRKYESFMQYEPVKWAGKEPKV